MSDDGTERLSTGYPSPASQGSQYAAKLKGSIGDGSNHSNFIEFLRSEFGQNSLRIEEILLEFIRNPKNSGMLNVQHFLQIFGEIPRNFHQNMSKIQ